MNNLRSDDSTDGEANALISQIPQTYVPTIQPTPPTDRVTYAQIIRPARIELPETSEQFDFRLQSPQQESNIANSVAITSGRSSISEVSSGYIDLTQNLSRPQVRRNARPTSPETSF